MQLNKGAIINDKTYGISYNRLLRSLMDKVETPVLLLLDANQQTDVFSRAKFLVSAVVQYLAFQSSESQKAKRQKTAIKKTTLKRNQHFTH